MQINTKHKMNEMVNKFLLARDKVMPEIHLRQSGFTYSVCGLFIKIIERIQEFKETKDSRSISQNKLGNVCFQHDMAYGDFKDLTRRTASDKIFCDKAFNITHIYLADIQLISKFDKGIRFLLYVIDIFS